MLCPLSSRLTCYTSCTPLLIIYDSLKTEMYLTYQRKYIKYIVRITKYLLHTMVNSIVNSQTP